MAGSSPLDLTPGTAVVFVGPNNAGKSLALREIESWCFGQETPRKVIETVEVDLPQTHAEATALLETFKTNPPPGQVALVDRIWVGQHTFRQDQPVRNFDIRLQQIESLVQGNPQWVRQVILGSYTVRLDGRTRFSLSDPKPGGDLQLPPQNHLWALFANDPARKRVRRLTEEAFGLYFVIDATGMTQFRIRMSQRPPNTDEEEQALDEAARRFHGGAQLISELSDGVQAFVGLVSAVLSLPHRVILLDEPEAFLHPPLARRLGADLANLAHERGASLVVATHSADFLIGCVEAEPDTTVVRLTYERGAATARALPATQLASMIRDPLMRSTGVLRALFHRAAVVTESDTDRAFHDEINRRLQAESRGIEEALFLNAQNKHTIHRLLRPLRDIGIPVVGVVDLDIIEEAAPFQALLSAARVPNLEIARMEAERAQVAAAFVAIPPTTGPTRTLKAQGMSALGTADEARTRKLMTDLERYGIFVVPGELESWLPALGATGHGPEWLLDVFGKIGGTPSDANWLAPAADDVWVFVDRIAAWARDPNRLGTT